MAEMWVAIVAGMAYWNVRKTGALVTATEKTAVAAKATVDEIQRDRELAYRPYLSRRSRTQGGKEITDATAYVVNFGRGPAIHCLCCIGFIAEQQGNLMTTPLFDLSPNEPSVREIEMQMRSGLLLDKDTAGTELGPEPVRVAFCQDQLGNYFRFVPYRVDADIYNPTTGTPRPRWMDVYMHQVRPPREALMANELRSPRNPATECSLTSDDAVWLVICKA